MSDTSVTAAIPAEPNWSGLPSNTDLSLNHEMLQHPSLDVLPLLRFSFGHAPLTVIQHRFHLLLATGTRLQKTGLTGGTKHFNFTGSVAKIIVMTRLFLTFAFDILHSCCMHKSKQSNTIQVVQPLSCTRSR